MECTCPPAANQFFFCQGSQLLVFIEWFAILDRGLQVGSVFFDLTKTFDSSAATF